MNIAEQTASQLEEVAENSKVITKEVTNIADTLETQTSEIKQINEGIEQINDVVQTNSATSQECAAASQDQKSANWLAEPITAAQRTANLKKMLNAVIDMEWEDIKRAYFQTQQEKYPVGSIWDNGVSVTLAGMEVCYHYLSAGNAPFIVNQMKPFFEKHFKKNRFRTHGERAGAIGCRG